MTSRAQIMQLGITAQQLGIETPQQLGDLVRRGMQAEWRLPMIVRALEDAQTALRGMS